jgi:hypothetical protein
LIVLEEELRLDHAQRRDPAVALVGLGEDRARGGHVAAIEPETARQEGGGGEQRGVATPGVAEERLGLIEIPAAQPLAAQREARLGTVGRQSMGAREVSLGSRELTVS